MENRRGPYFLGIGAPRCGTTWLHNMLRLHPDVWLPPLKEVHYFDSIDPSLRLHQVDRLGFRLRQQFVRRSLHYGAALLGPLAGANARKAKPDFGWDRRYFSPGGSIDWYQQLFDAKRDRYRMVGEITPGYFILSEPVIASIRQNTSVDRLIVLLRDPIDSAWSGFGRKVREGQAMAGDHNHDHILDKLLGPAILRRLYASNLKRWMSVFPREQIFIGFYEDLASRPAELLDDICAFLGVAPLSQHLGARLTERMNSSQAHRGDIPAVVELALAKRLVDDLSSLSGLLGGHATRWHQRALDVVHGAKSAEALPLA